MEDVIKDLFEILVILNVNVVNYVMLETIQVIKIVNAEKDKLIEECSESIDGNKMIYNDALND